MGRKTFRLNLDGYMPSFLPPKDAHPLQVQQQQLCAVFWWRESMNEQPTLSKAQ
jgi:hypothetical protein